MSIPQIQSEAIAYALSTYTLPSASEVKSYASNRKLPVKEFTDAISEFVGKGWIRQPKEGYWGSYEILFVTPGGINMMTRLVSRKTFDAVFNKLEKVRLDRDVRMHVTVMKAAVNFIQTGRLPAPLSETFSEDEIKTWASMEAPVMVQLLDYDHWKPFVEALPAKIIAYAALRVAQDTADARGFDVTSDKFRDYLMRHLSKEAAAEYRDWRHYYADFLCSGKPHELLKKMNCESPWYMIVSAAASIMDNEEPSNAVSCMKTALSRLHQIHFETWFEAWLYAIALYRDRANPASVRKLERMMEVKRIAENVYLKPAILIALLGCGRDARKAAVSFREAFMEALPGESIESLNPQIAVPFAITALNFGLLEKIDFMGENARNWMSFLPMLDFAFQRLTGRNEEAESIARKYGIKQFLPHYVIRPEWDLVLDRLIARPGISGGNGQDYTEGQLPTERIAYAVDTEKPGWEITIRSQKFKATTRTWLKGTVMKLSTFVERAPKLSDEAQRVANAVHLESLYWTRGMQVLNVPEALMELVGSQNVIDAKTLEPIDVEKRPLEISVLRNNDTYSFTNNLSPEFDPEEDKISLTRASSSLIIVTRPTDNERELLKAVRGINFPLAAREKLTHYLEKLSARTPVMSDLLKDSKHLEKQSGDARITFRLEPFGAGTHHVTALVHPVADNPLACSPGEGLAFIATRIGTKTVQVARDLKKERKNFDELLSALSRLEELRDGEFSWELPVAETLEMLEVLRTHADTALLEWPEGVKFRVSRPQIFPSSLKLSLRSMGSWFELEGKVQIDEKTMLTVNELLERLRESEGRFIRLGDDEYVALTESLKKELEHIESLVASQKKGELRISAFNAGSIEKLGEEGIEIDSDEAFRSLCSRIRAAEHFSPKIPGGLKTELRPYQQEGFEWLSRLISWGAGALLADDMGLGKTIQAIALLLSRAKEGPQLVVMPAAVLFNWSDELQRFAPGLSAKMLQQAEDRKKLVDEAEAGDVVLTTYGILSAEIEALSGREWATVVLDEAHNIKNRDTRMSKAAMQLKSAARVLLTGTPLQNNLGEIWNLFEFANPGLLGSSQSFAERFIIPIERNKDRNCQRLLKRLISPFILRRTKAEVLDELPEKTEVTLRVELSEAERTLYESLRETASQRLETGEINPIEALAELMKLRQAACAAELVNPKLKLESSKINAFLKLADTLIEGGHRALVFSQFTSYLAILRKELDKKKIKYLYLDGATPAGQRQKLVDAFQKGEMPLFLISLKAGGTGLNLTAADYVAILDPWWNPAIESQASDRAYRIGQENPVTIYRLIAENTIEEKIIRLHETKKSLADALLEGSDMSNRLSRDEILRLLAED